MKKKLILKISFKIEFRIVKIFTSTLSHDTKCFTIYNFPFSTAI